MNDSGNFGNKGLCREEQNKIKQTKVPPVGIEPGTLGNLLCYILMPSSQQNTPIIFITFICFTRNDFMYGCVLTELLLNFHLAFRNASS